MTVKITDEMVEAGANVIAKTLDIASSIILRRMHAWANYDARAVIAAVAPLIAAQERAENERLQLLNADLQGLMVTQDICLDKLRAELAQARAEFEREKAATLGLVQGHAKVIEKLEAELSKPGESGT